jgi:hypothetical protein
VVPQAPCRQFFRVPGQALAGGLGASSVVKILVMIWSVWAVLVP